MLLDDAPRRKYFTIPHNERSVNHWGQRKLLLSEIEFLTEYSKDGDIVVYAGAAPGTHIPYLAKLFPQLEYYLYDPADFNVTTKDNIYVFQEYFTDNTVRDLRASISRRILFICDIRTADAKVMLPEEIEDSIQHDMLMQMNWV